MGELPCEFTPSLWRAPLPTATQRMHKFSHYAPHYSGMTYDELIQEAVFAFYRAVCTYDGTKNVAFGHYAAVCVQNALISVYRVYKRQNDRVFTVLISEDRFSTDGFISYAEDPMLTTIAKEELRSALASILPLLSNFELRVFRAYADGKTSDMIAKELDVGVRSVQNAIDRIKRKFRNHYHVHMPR